jgi:hypothetical protein
MIPFRFGPPARRLFGLYHPVSPAASRHSAVLLCNPFGQEAIRSHRLQRVLAERLARDGIAVLRFDYYGTGDSGGDDGDGDLEGWTGDVLAAHEELMNRSAAQRVAWMGARLGATLAVKAAAGAALSKLVLWDPIADGAAYLALLRTRHVEALHEAFSLPDPAWKRRLHDDPAAFTGEAIGFEISAALRRQLAAVRPDGLPLPASVSTQAIVSTADEAARGWVRIETGRGAKLGMVLLDHAFDWMASGALNTALVPAQALQELTAALDE